MSETIAFGNGGFNLGTLNQSGTNNLDVDDRNGVFTLFNSDSSTIVGLGLQGSANSDRNSVAFGTPPPPHREIIKF